VVHDFLQLSLTTIHTSLTQVFNSGFKKYAEWELSKTEKEK